MTSPGTMKTIQKRLYTAVQPTLSRVRSNSASSSSSSQSTSSNRSLYTSSSSTPPPLPFFDSPSPPTPPPTSRLNSSPARLPVKGEGAGEGQQSNTSHSNASHQPPFSLALTSTPAGPNTPPHAPSSSPYPPGSHSFYPYPGHRHALHGAHSREERERKDRKRRGPRYQLDVGAYGIAKKRPGHGNTHSDLASETEDLGLSVQVGEDAYFVRDNAMGVADGVGGWAKARHRDGSGSSKDIADSPSALFARRLMNFCAVESEAASAPISIPTSRTTSPPPTRTASPSPWPWHPSRTPFPTPLHHFPDTAIDATSPLAAWESAEDEWADDMDLESEAGSESDMSDFEEGLDVLMMLERAYESAIRAHVVPPTPSTEGASDTRPKSDQTASGGGQRDSGRKPLMQGSSTALLAVLDHHPLRPPLSRSQSPAPPRSRTASLASPQPRARSPLVPASSPGPTTRALLHSPLPPITEAKEARGSGAVLKIAHLGDCMGMLVRGEEIVWRSEEMWWAWNTPVQLGPLAPSRPATHAHTFTLPIQRDDILILASDGLSDNLWDEDVLDEVVRMRRSFLPAAPAAEDAGEVGLLGRRTLAGMLSEALCSRARRVSERRPSKSTLDEKDDEVPFARRAREQGRAFRGGKVDDISVVVAVISPAEAGAKQSGVRGRGPKTS
ncbi:hypothetical protein HWV62_20434 [Athelia sp. TMB]|nr:hypothetical protein HWV62_20434 [Athelia sp. TMB]